MKTAIGLPNAVPDTSGGDLVEFARRADQRGFSSLGTIDRLVYGNYEPLAALAAAAAVTERIGLLTSVMLGPLRLNAVQTAKQALSISALSDGRLTLGIGLGARGDDFEASGVAYEDTGAMLEEMLDYMVET
ncbi:MAG TPA: LLM class flavin-dependent oxidoreductase, partial [Solirubrobacterales bacterium]|nr:LLM class flavin-dependent oxidoreductase [Solirubrobacterales bacterium]